MSCRTFIFFLLSLLTAHVSDDELVLVNGIANSGRPAELVRRKKDGRLYSLSTGKLYTVQATPSTPRTPEKLRPRPPIARPTLDDSPTRQLREARARISRNPDFMRLIEARIKHQAEIQGKNAVKLAPTREAGVKRSLDVTLSVSTDEPPSDVSRSMARRKKGEAPMDVKALCRFCSRRFRRPCDLTKHMKTHTRPYKCPEPQCKYFEVGWPTEKERDRHVNDKHSKNPKLYHCEFGCGYQSKRESNCKQHMEKTHAYTYERTKRCSTSKKSSSVNGSVLPTINMPNAQMRPQSISPTTPAASTDGLSMPHTPVSGYTSSNTPAPFSAFPTPASTTPVTTPGSHGSVSGTSSASTPAMVAAQGSGYESGTNESSIAPQQSSGLGGDYHSQLGAMGNGSTATSREGDFSFIQNANPFAQNPENQENAVRQKASFDQLTDAESVPQFGTDNLGMNQQFFNNVNADGNVPFADGTASTLDYFMDNLNPSANTPWNMPDFLNTSNDLGNLNGDLSTNFNFGNFNFDPSTMGSAAGLPNDYYNELSTLQDNMEIDVTEMNQEAALFYQSLQQGLGENNTVNNTPNGMQTTSTDKIALPGNSMQWNAHHQQQQQQPAQDYANQPALHNATPVQSAQNGFTGMDKCFSVSSSSSQSERSVPLSPPSLGGSPASISSTLSFNEVLNTAIAAQSHGQNLSQDSQNSTVKDLFANHDWSVMNGPLRAPNAPGNARASFSSNLQGSFNEEDFVTFSAAASQNPNFGSQQNHPELDLFLYGSGNELNGAAF